MSIKDIAKMADVSASTVSLVLNNRAEELRISKSTQERVRKAAAEIGYTPRSMRKMHKQGGVSVVVFLATYTSNIMAGNYVVAYQRISMELGENVDISIRFYETTRLSQCKAFLAGGFDGAIIMSPGVEDYEFLHSRHFRFPVVLHNRVSDKLPYVTLDYDRAGETAVRLLLEKGHRKLAIVAPDTENERNTHLRPFLDIVRGRDVDYCNVIVRELSMDGGRQAAELLEQFRPTGVFFAVDIMALGAVPRLQELGISIPGDMEILTFGPQDTTRYSRPPLSTIHMPAEELVESAVDLLLSYVAGDRRRKSITVDVDVHFRESFTPAAGK